MESYSRIWISTLQDHHFNGIKKKMKGKCQLQLANAEPEQKPVLVLDGLMHCGFLQIVIHIITLFFFPLTVSFSLFPFQTESTVFFPEQIRSVEEDVGELFIPVHRSGDISEELMVVCYTQQGTGWPFFTSSNPFPPLYTLQSCHICRQWSHHLVNGIKSWVWFTFVIFTCIMKSQMSLLQITKQIDHVIV